MAGARSKSFLFGEREQENARAAPGEGCPCCASDAGARKHQIAFCSSPWVSHPLGALLAGSRMLLGFVHSSKPIRAVFSAFLGSNQDKLTRPGLYLACSG